MDPSTPTKTDEKNNFPEDAGLNTPQAPSRAAPRPTTAAINLVIKPYLEAFERRTTLDDLYRWSSLLECKDIGDAVDDLTFTIPNVPEDESEEHYNVFRQMFVMMPNLRTVKIRGTRMGVSQALEAVDVGVQQLLLALSEQNANVTIANFELTAANVEHSTLINLFESQKPNLYYVALENVLVIDGSWNPIFATLRGAELTVAYFKNLKATPHPDYAAFWGSDRTIRPVWNDVTNGLESVASDTTEVAMTGREAVRAGLDMLLESSEWVKVDA